MEIDWNIASITAASLFAFLLLLLIASALVQRKKINNIVKRQQQIESEFSAIVSGNLDLGRRVLRLGKIMHHIERSQNDLKHGQISDKAIDQAATMIRNGIAVDEVMSTCDISRGEAELLRQMLDSNRLH